MAAHPTPRREADSPEVEPPRRQEQSFFGFGLADLAGLAAKPLDRLLDLFESS
jgi:hypothetical protein